MPLPVDHDIKYSFNNSPEKALEQLIQTHMGLVYTIVNSKLKTYFTREDIEECVSDIFLEAFNKRNDLVNEEKGSIKAYLAILARRRAIDYYRKLAKTKTNVPLDDIPEAVSVTSTEASFLEKETRMEMVSIIKGLGPPDSEILIRKFYMGQNAKEISKAINMKENTVNKKISRGIEKLKQIMGGKLNGAKNL